MKICVQPLAGCQPPPYTRRMLPAYMQHHCDLSQDKPAPCFISEGFACPSACLSDHPSALVFTLIYLSYLASLPHGPSTPFPICRLSPIPWVSVLPGTPGNGLLYLGLNMASYDLSQQWNTPEKVLFRTVKITKRVKADYVRNLLENRGWGTSHWSIKCLLCIHLLSRNCVDHFETPVCSRQTPVIPQKLFSF